MVAKAVGTAHAQLVQYQQQLTKPRRQINLQVPYPVMNLRKPFLCEILSKKSSDECQWQEDDGHHGQLLHR